MESAIIVSSTAGGDAFFQKMLKEAGYTQITVIRTCGEARRFITEYETSMVVINAPLSDETGESMARHLAQDGNCQVLLVVKNEYYEAITEHTQDYGVITIAKPIHRTLFWSALHLAKASQRKMERIQIENKRLNKRLQDIKMIDRAKCMLIECENLTEAEAHKYIEKQSMDRRMAKRIIAEEIIKSYENDG